MRGTLFAVKRCNIREPMSGSDYTALVAAQSRALTKLIEKLSR
jgi:hypothetical protein